MKLAVVIVSWNVRELLRKCLVSLLADIDNAGVAARVMVVDSASADQSAQMVQSEFASVEITASTENIGFVRGNNLALRQLGLLEDRAVQVPEYTWLLNPDTEVQPGAIELLLGFMGQHPRCGLCGPRLLNTDGSLQHGAFEFPGLTQLALETQPLLWRFRGTRLDGRYMPETYAAGKPFHIGHPLGAAMLARSAAIMQVGGLDAGYEMYSEEVDWAMRMKKAGWERWCVPAAVVVHHGGASSGQANERAERTKWLSRKYYYARHYSSLKRWLAYRLIPAQYRSR
jgi:N-acetylglucosaminyl-diphospho-decaprenol L-rhamnosyltransferase